MSLNQNLGNLSKYITADSSGNITIAGSLTTGGNIILPTGADRFISLADNTKSIIVGNWTSSDNYATILRGYNNVGIGVNGVTAMTIDNGQNVYIGTTQNTSYKFIVRKGTNQNIGFGVQNSAPSIEAFNDAVNAGAPLSIWGSTLSFYGSGNQALNISTAGNVNIVPDRVHYNDKHGYSWNGNGAITNGGTSNFDFNVGGNAHFSILFTIGGRGNSPQGGVYMMYGYSYPSGYMNAMLLGSNGITFGYAWVNSYTVRITVTQSSGADMYYAASAQVSSNQQVY